MSSTIIYMYNIYTYINSMYLYYMDCLGCVVLLCFVVCMALLASPSTSLINMIVQCAYVIVCSTEQL